MSKRVQSGDSLYSLYPCGDFESGWRAFDRIWPFRFWSLRNFFWLECLAYCGLVYPWSDDLAGDHYCQRRIVARCAAGTARGFAGAWRYHLANDSQERLALCAAGYSDLVSPGYRACRW